MSLFIRLQTSFWNHRKTIRLQLSIGEDAFWLPPRLWSYAAEHQPDGDFSDYSADDLKVILAYRGDATSMLQALQASGFMDDMKIHGWSEHNAFHTTFSIRARKAAEVRWEKEKNQKKEVQRVQRKGKRASIAKPCLGMLVACLPKCLNNKEFQSEWEQFVKHRIKKRAPMTEYAAQLILKTLSEHPDRAAGAVQTAIKRNWTGFEWDWVENLNGRNGQDSGSEPSEFQQRDSKINELNRRKQAMLREHGDKVYGMREYEQIEKQLMSL